MTRQLVVSDERTKTEHEILWRTGGCPANVRVRKISTDLAELPTGVHFLLGLFLLESLDARRRQSTADPGVASTMSYLRACIRRPKGVPEIRIRELKCRHIPHASVQVK